MSELSLHDLSHAVSFPSFGSAVSASRLADISGAIFLILARLAARAIFSVLAINPR